MCCLDDPPGYIPEMYACTSNTILRNNGMGYGDLQYVMAHATDMDRPHACERRRRIPTIDTNAMLKR